MHHNTPLPYLWPHWFFECFLILWRHLDLSYLQDPVLLYSTATCCVLCVLIFICLHAGQKHSLTHVKPASSPTQHTPSHIEGSREQASLRAPDQRALDRSVKALWKDIHGYTSWHAFSCLSMNTHPGWAQSIHTHTHTHTEACTNTKLQTCHGLQLQI